MNTVSMELATKEMKHLWCGFLVEDFCSGHSGGLTKPPVPRGGLSEEPQCFVFRVIDRLLGDFPL